MSLVLDGARPHCAARSTARCTCSRPPTAGTRSRSTRCPTTAASGWPTSWPGSSDERARRRAVGGSSRRARRSRPDQRHWAPAVTAVRGAGRGRRVPTPSPVPVPVLGSRGPAPEAPFAARDAPRPCDTCRSRKWVATVLPALAAPERAPRDGRSCPPPITVQRGRRERLAAARRPPLPRTRGAALERWPSEPAAARRDTTRTIEPLRRRASRAAPDLARI